MNLPTELLLGKFILWDGRPAKVIGIINRDAAVIEFLDDHHCPHCGGSLGKDHVTSVIGSPQFKENVASMPTVSETSLK